MEIKGGERSRDKNRRREDRIGDKRSEEEERKGYGLREKRREEIQNNRFEKRKTE